MDNSFDVNRIMTPAEFVKTGCLQEINRQLLHPRGLAMSVVIDEETEQVTGFGPIYISNRPEGYRFNFAQMEQDEFLDCLRKQDVFDSLDKSNVRTNVLSYMVERVDQ